MVARIQRTAKAGSAIAYPEADDIAEMQKRLAENEALVLYGLTTAKGKIYKTEGIVGLTRAFMFAGAPRVICSLWRVPDEATQKLMIEFYRLWNPKDGSKGLPTATALKRAQEYIRTYEKQVLDKAETAKQGQPVYKTVRPWEHPYYWAAWVLWGLGD